SRDDLAGIRAACDRGKKAMSRQKYDIKNELANGDCVALEILWTGTLAVPFQTKLAGEEMRAHFAAFFQFNDGKIIAQRNYDCYEP
ncbi:MAG TPA: nuclear transport factor 2 family protein, partial [Candidatus Dormibacteraeota bacterium]|nr:nuclear transport factor 2 family protein [Candidatus Dormibacteraeota bacterium]